MQATQAMPGWALAGRCAVGRHLDLFRNLKNKYDLVFLI